MAFAHEKGEKRKAILINDDKSLSWASVRDPTVTSENVLVKIHAAALNSADLMQREGDYPPPPGAPEWMGLEISGEIVQSGNVAKEKSKWKIGDKVCALLGGGGYAEYVAVKYDMLMPVPKNCTMVEAAAIPEAFATAYLNLFIEGKIKEGSTLLMHAGASGLASVIIPMAKAFGIRVITSVLSDEIAESVKPLGADVIINTSKQKTYQSGMKLIIAELETMAHNNDDRALLFDYKSAYEHICNQNISAALEYVSCKL